MRKLFLLFALLISLAAKADEGMWTLFNLPNAIYEQMKAEGFKLDKDQLYESDNAVYKAVVNFSGYCTGVVVSPDGLVFTNHHCGFEAIRSHSTVEHDYMLNGFIANSYAEELPNENMFVSFMIAQADITDVVQEVIQSASDSTKITLDSLSRDDLVGVFAALQERLTEEIRKETGDENVRVEIDAFYEGNRYYATTYRDFKDVRLVFAVPKSMGKFGGETDNWMWPRQTCDFSVFRIYADPKTNGPADYSKDNVPYHPKHWAPVSLQGYQEGDFAMTMGYPGSTSRYLSSYGIRERRDCDNTPTAQVRGVKQEVMKRHMNASEAVRIKYDSKYAQSANYWKNSIGMNKCIDSIGIIQQKEAYERKIYQWMKDNNKYLDKLDFDKMAELYANRREASTAFTYFSETFNRTSLFNRRALRMRRMPLMGPADNEKKQYIIFEDESADWDDALDKEVMAVVLKNYREHVSSKYLPDFYKTIDKDFAGNYAAYVDYLYKNSYLMQSGKKIYINKKKNQKDPGYQYFLDLQDILGQLFADVSEGSEQIDTYERYLCDAKVQMEQDMPHYSDANFTLRLSYGQVGGFSLNGNPSGYYTTPQSIVAKMNRGEQVQDYFAEPIMKELLSVNDYGVYQDKNTGTLQLCFLTNNDITGGNSGSPMFDGEGRLIGLAFDGNWDSLSSDIFFDSNLARCIGVDIRFVLYMMDKWGHADRLLKEINAK